MLNLGKFLNKKVIFIFIIVLLLIVGGVFWWQKNKIESFLESKELEKMVALSKDYSIAEDSNGKFIINEKDGLKVKVPSQWEAEIGMDMSGLVDERYVTLYSNDFSYRPPKGCLVEIQISRLQKRRVEYYGEDFEMYPYEGAKEVKEMIDSYKEAAIEEREGIKIISVDQKDALQETRILEGEIGKHISIKIPTENKVYILECVLFSEECDEQLNQFLETVSVK
jgi:hypothetical protein